MDSKNLETDKSGNYFVACFIGLYALFQGLYFLVPIDWLNEVVYRWLLTEPCASIINFFSSSTEAKAYNSFLRSSSVNLEIVRGCDGSGVLFLLLAAVLAFKTTLIKKMTGLFFGAVFVYVINMIRIIVIYYILRDHEAYFVEFHTLIAPTIIIILCSILFMYWTQWSRPDVRT